MAKPQVKIRRRRILSGMRPTGPLHLGHLVGALRNWAELQEEYECFYMVADWHALLSEYARTAPLKEYVKEMVADWLSVGLDPENCGIFLQSELKEHADLYLILSAITPLPWLERCPTYKDQLREIKGRDLLTYGFLGYPVLQAADILIYRAAAVPVGQDQLPHLELTREIARRFNNFYGSVFPEPRALLSSSPKLLGLDNRKMSKSYGNFIALSDSPEVIEKKVKSMITDPKRIRLHDPGHPEVCAVFSYYRVFQPALLPELEDSCRRAKLGCTDCKARLARILIDYLAPIREKREEWLKGDRIEQVLEAGGRRAHQVASETINRVYQAIGI